MSTALPLPQVLHITPHLGGGVGKAVATLIEQTQGLSSKHHVLCLEAPQKLQFADQIRACGVAIDVAPSQKGLQAQMAQADIVQVEFWNHPQLLAVLASAALPAARLLMWCHVSGLTWPCVPRGLPAQVDRLLLTASHSLQAPELAALTPASAARVAVVSSGAGLERLPQPPTRTHARARYGYLGSLNPAKLHPQFVELLAAVPLPNLHVEMIGDSDAAAALQARCQAVGRAELLSFNGYRSDSATALAELDVLVYLLNPQHYGTAENALLEAMAMGVVPVVWNNPAERAIVEHGRTGLIVNTQAELNAALLALDQDLAMRQRLGQAAAAEVRARYSSQQLAAAFNTHYQALMQQPKIARDLRLALGSTPAQWFTAFARDAWFSADGSIDLPPALQPALTENTKGSVFHFSRSFSDDRLLAAWAQALAAQTTQPITQLITQQTTEAA